ncbi:MAG: ABC transporter ATP-binding protein [Anaerolineae bacterium]
MTVALHLKGVSHTYTAVDLAPRTVLNIADWCLNAGEFALLRGVSGSGKTTLMNVIAGLLQPSQGAVAVEGQSVYELSEAARDRFRATHIGYVFQTHNLLPYSALDNVEMPLAFLGESGRTRREKARAMLNQVGLSGYEKHRPQQLSSGQRLRVAIARALVAKPSLLLADEPTAALDPDNGAQIIELITQTCRSVGAALLVASHDPRLSSYFQRVVDLKDQQLREVQAI